MDYYLYGYIQDSVEAQQSKHEFGSGVDILQTY
jgi:hypothetical protein